MIRKSFAVLSVGIVLACSSQAQDSLKTVKLNTPDTKRGGLLMKAFSERKSVRVFGEKELNIQDLSDLLWAANGVNRPQDKKRTAPSAMNSQDIDIYVFKKSGVYLYDAFENQLGLVLGEDLRAVAAKQDFAQKAPVLLLLVSDLSRLKGNDASKAKYSAIDAGIVSQNISLFCAGVSLGTVPIGMVDGDMIKKKLKLKDSQVVLLGHPVGYLESANN